MMDGSHYNFFDHNITDANEDDEFLGEAPVIVVRAERRMQVRAYCHWSNLLRQRHLPLIADLKLDRMTDIADHAVLLDVTGKAATPAIAYIGAAIAAECGIKRTIHHCDDVPATSLLALVIGRYGDSITGQSPVGFEDEFVNAAGTTYLCRGMLLPFASAENGPVSHVLGVVNWKECANDALSEDLADQLRASLGVGAKFSGHDAWDAEPAPMLHIDTSHSAHDKAIAALDGADYAPVSDDMAQAMSLADWLASARELAQAATLATERPHSTLYAAIGRTYDFELMTRNDPRGLDRLLAGAGLVPQRRNPLVPLVRLVFGKTHDKTRVAEIAAALAHGRRLGLARGEMTLHLARVAGGLKGVVAEERRLRAAEKPRRRRSDPARDKLAALPVRPMASLPEHGPELTILIARRMQDGTLALVGEAGDDQTMLERAAQMLI